MMEKIKIVSNCRMKNIQKTQKNMVIFIRQQADEILDWFNVGKGNEAYASHIRVFVLIAIIVMWRIVHYKYGYNYAVAMNLVLFLAFIAWIPMEKPVNYEEPLHPIISSWLVLCFLQFISDIFLKKDFEYSEFICVWMVFCFGLLYRAWKRMKNPERLLDDFVRAVEILFLMNVIFCLLGDARKAHWSNMMTGTRTNPNPFAMGVALCFVLFLFRFGQKLSEKKKWYCYLKDGIGIAACIWMLKEAGSRNAWLIVGVASFFFVIFLLRKYIKGVFFLYKILGIAIILTVIALFIMKGNQILQMNMMEIVDMLSTGRLTTWKAYLSQINFIGNSNLLKFEDGTLAPHNGIIMLMYRYGFFTGVAGIVFLVQVIRTIGSLWKNEMASITGNTKNVAYVFYMVGILIAYLFPSMLDTCDEGIMGWTNWFAFYFMIGCAIQEKQE